jgi:hypothetical protein
MGDEESDKKSNPKKFSIMGSVFGSSYLGSISSYCQYKLKDNSPENKAICAFSADGKNLIVI